MRDSIYCKIIKRKQNWGEKSDIHYAISHCIIYNLQPQRKALARWLQHCGCKMLQSLATLLRVVGSKFDHFQTWTNNTHVATCHNKVGNSAEHVVPNNVAIVWPGSIKNCHCFSYAKKEIDLWNFTLAGGLWCYKQFPCCFFVVNLEHTDFKLS